MPRYFKEKIYNEAERAIIAEAAKKKMLDKEAKEFEREQDIRYKKRKLESVKDAFAKVIRIEKQQKSKI